MSAKQFIAFAAPLLLIGCSGQEPNEEADLASMSKADKVAAINEACKLPEGVLTLEGDTIAITPHEAMDQPKTGCLFQELRIKQVGHVKTVGFVMEEGGDDFVADAAGDPAKSDEPAPNGTPDQKAN